MTQIEALYIGEKDAAARLGLQVATLRAWRGRREKLPFARFGRRVRYSVQALDEFAAQSTVQPG